MNCPICKEKVSGEAFVVDDEVIHQGCRRQYFKKLRGLTHPCPKCKTSGKMDHPGGETASMWVPVSVGESADCSYNGCRGCPHCGQKKVSNPARVNCDLCDGEGYLEHEPVPVKAITSWVKG